MADGERGTDECGSELFASVKRVKCQTWSCLIRPLRTLNPPWTVTHTFRVYQFNFLGCATGEITYLLHHYAFIYMRVCVCENREIFIYWVFADLFRKKITSYVNTRINEKHAFTIHVRGWRDRFLFLSFSAIERRVYGKQRLNLEKKNIPLPKNHQWFRNDTGTYILCVYICVFQLNISIFFFNNFLFFCFYKIKKCFILEK